LGWPLVNQLAGGPGPNDADGVAENRWNDCLPASLAASLAWFGLGDFEPDALKDAVYGDGYKGYTSAAKFVALMASLGLRLTVQVTDDPRPVVEAALRGGKAVIARSYEPEGFYHYAPVIGFDGETVTRHNPLGGLRETLSWRDWLYRYVGDVTVAEKES
jgi:hypothetical protein